MAEKPQGGYQRLHASKYIGVVIATVGDSTRYCAAMHIPTMAPATPDQVSENSKNEGTEIFYIGAFKHEISAAIAADVARWGPGRGSCEPTSVPWNFHALAMCLVSTTHASFPNEVRAVCAGLLADGIIDSLLACNLSGMEIFRLDPAAVRQEFVRYYGDQVADGLRASVDAVCQSFPADILNAFNAHLWPREAWSGLLSRLAAAPPPPPPDGAPKPPCIRVAVARRAQCAPPTDPAARVVHLPNGVALIHLDDKYSGVVGRWRAVEQDPVLPDDYYAACRLPDGAPANCQDVSGYLTGHHQTVELTGPFAHELSAAVEQDAFQLFVNNNIGACNFPCLAYHFVGAMRGAGAQHFPKGEAGRLMDTVILPSLRQLGYVQFENEAYGMGAWPVEAWSELLLASPAAPVPVPVRGPQAQSERRPPRAEGGVVGYSPCDDAEDEIQEVPEEDDEARRVEDLTTPPEEDESDTVTFNFWWHCPNVHPADPPVKTWTVERTYQRSATTACACRVHSDMINLFPFAAEFAHVRNDVRYRPSRRVESLLEDISNAQGNEGQWQ